MAILVLNEAGWANETFGNIRKTFEDMTVNTGKKMMDEIYTAEAGIHTYT